MTKTGRYWLGFAGPAPIFARNIYFFQLMKRFLLLLSCLALVPGLQAQQFRYGFSIAPARNMAVPESDLYDETVPVYTGFQYGLIFDQTIGKGEFLAITAGFNLNYTQSGMTSTDNNAAGDDKEWVVRARYIEVPITLRLRTPELGSFVFYGEGGAAFGKCFRAIGDYIETSNSGQVSGDRDLDYFDKNNSNGVSYLPNNMGLQLGAGTEIGITENASILVGFFYQKGLMSVYEDNSEKFGTPLNQIGFRIAGLF